MLEGIVANLLNRFLGMYVRNFDPKQLSVGIWNGDVVLRNLELRKEALDQLQLPLNVVEGYLGQLTLSIPWSNLRGKPVKINIEDVFVLAGPKGDDQFNAEEEERRAHALKMEKLDSAELLRERNIEGMSPEEQKKNESFTTSLVTAIVDNVQVSIKNIHIRYEDSISDPGHPFAAGLTLRELSAVSTDDKWQPTFIQSTSGTTHKLATLGALAAYWDTDTKLMGSGTGDTEKQTLGRDAVLARFRELSAQADDKLAAEHQFILKPVSGRAGIEMDKTGKTDRPKTKARLLFDELGFVIDEDQYRDALMLLDLFHYYILHQEYKKLEPKSRPKEDPRAWLKFAGNAVLTKIHDRNRRWSWAYFKERRDDRVRYIALFKKKKKDEKLSSEEAQELDKLEHKLSYEDLRFWRSLARNQLRKENVGVKKQQAQKQSWSSWVWAGGKKQEQQPAEDNTQLSEQQREELYKAIDWDEKQSLTEAVEMPKDAVILQIEMNLRTGGFTLKRDPHGKATEILRLRFDDFSTEVLQRPDSFYAQLSLEAMRLYDGTTEGSRFPQIITVKDSPGIRSEKRIGELNGDNASQPSGVDGAEEADDPLFQFSFEQNPLDGSADTALTMKLKAMEVIYNPTFVVEVARFFKPPERHMESIGALMETAGATVEGLRQQTRAGLEFALQEHKTVNAQLDLQAPLIIVPDSVTEESTLCLILDAGHASVSSELVDKATLQEIESKQRHQYTDEDYKRLEGLMYDKFILKLESTQVLIGPSIEETRAQLQARDESKNLHIIDRINMDFTIESSILPKASDITKFRISGHLPVLHALISDAKYKSLMKLLDVAIPKFDETPNRNKPVNGTQSHSAAKPAATATEGKTATARPRSKSFQFSAQEHELLAEEETDEDKSQARYQEASQGKEDPEVVVQQRNFEFKFVVDKLQGSLYRSDADGKKPDQLLVEVIAEHFRLDFYQRPYDMVAEVSLRSLCVEDHVEQDPRAEFKNIISSEDVSGTSKKDLFKVNFVKVNADHPDFLSSHEGFSTNLDIDVSTINVIVTRKTLLTLLDFVLVTFTNQDATSGSANKAIEGAEEPGPEEQHEKEMASKPQQDADKMRIKARLTKISMILNNDGIRLATLSLQTADVAVTMMGIQMRVAAKLGNVSLIDDVNLGVPEDSPLRQLLTIQGDQLADFSYETFDPETDTYPGYDTKIYLRSGSLIVNFLTEPFRKIMEFGVKFGRMQAVFNAARQAAANQASQIQESASKMHFDILIKTPIVVFPRVTVGEQAQRDVVTAYLGELYANNRFTPLDDSKDSDVSNQISAGVRNIRLTSDLHYPDDKLEVLELIDKVNLDFKINYIEHKPGFERPDLEVEGNMSDINLRLTQYQLQFMLELSRTIPAAFATEADEVLEKEVEQELPQLTMGQAQALGETKPKESVKERPANLAPELGSNPETWTKLDLIFKVGAVGLELVQGNENAPVGDLEKASLSKFALNETNVKLRMVSDGSLEAELLVKSFTIKDSRTRETNKFRKIMSLINTDIKQQFMASVSISGGQEKNLIALLTVDSPRVILALDYLLAVQAFINTALATDEPPEVEEESEDSAADGTASVVSAQSSVSGRDKTQATITNGPSPNDQDGMNISYRVNVVDAQIVLLANPAISSSEAIVLGTKQVLVSQQHAMTLQVDKLGIFLCRMDKFDTSRLRILDDFSIQTSIDMRSQNKQSQGTNIHVNIEPLVLRLSLRDILLVMQIANRATALSGEDDKKMQDAQPEKIKELKGTSMKPRQKSIAGRRPSTVAQNTAQSVQTERTDKRAARKQDSAGTAIIMRREELTVQFGGIRVVLIGDLHELPILDWSVKSFDVEVRDWTANLTADTSIDTLFNVYNFSKSAWEPLIEPWQLGFHMSQEQNPNRLSVELYSRKSLELTLTAATIALASKSAEFLSTDEDVLSKPRGTDAPFRIRNYTGFDLDVWAHTSNGNEGATSKLSDGEEAPWRFEDPTTTRETLSPEGATGAVSIRLQGSGFDSIDRIPVHREGEALYNLNPRKDKVQHRLLVEVTLGTDNIKYITFRSPLLVENKTQIPLEIGVYSPEEGHLLKIEKVPPGSSRPAPVGAAFMHSLVVRPDQGFGYTWSNERIFWKDLLKRPTRTITCRGEQADQSPPFHFQMNAVFDKNDPLVSVYPYMRIKLSAPVEIQNLLPYDFKYRVYDKNTKKDWTNFLRKGGVSPVHVVELSHLLLMSVDIQDTPFKQSEFAIINGSDREDFRREKTIVVKDTKDLTLRLKLHYYNIPDSGGAFKVTVYAPYIVLNRTGLPLDIRSKAFLGKAQPAAGLSMLGDSDSQQRRAQPIMFSFPNDDRKNRAMIKIGDTQWSKPQSFDAIGSNYAVALAAASGRSEMNIGVTVDEGEGKYNLAKLVTLTPRFVGKNKLKEDLNIREPGSSDILTMKPDELLPLRFLRQGAGQQICLCFPGVSNQWSSPFNISNTGTVHVKIAKHGQRQQLVRVEILMEGATIFIHLSIETKHWPFSIRNESDTEFIFYQANPNLDEDEEDRGSGWKPVRYRLPPRSIMPYAWDYPAAKNKDLILNVNGKERHVKLAEIGNQIPMKLPPAPGSNRQKIIDINVAADGPTQTLVLSNYRPSRSLYQQRSDTATKSSSTGFEVKEMDTDVTFKAQLRLAGLGISLVNRQLRELLYLTFRDLELKYNESALYQTLNTTIKWIQVDNQLYGGIFPIIFYPSVVPKTGREMEAHPIFHSMVTRVKDDSYGVLYIKYFTFLLQQMTIELDEDFIFALLDFIKIPGASWSEEKEGKLCDDELNIPEPKQEQSGQDVYFELLHLQPMQFDLSFVRTERINAEDTMTSSNPFMFAVNVLTMSIGNVNDAPIRYNALMLENARLSTTALITNIQNHYVQESLRQVHIVLGSADFLGNPVGLFNNVSSGIADVFYEPYQGLVMTDRPQELGLGIAKGASSFVKKSVFGFSDSFSKWSGSMSKGLAAATLDKEFQDKRRMARTRNRPKHALYGITAGGNAFASSVASGIGGLARHPLEGAEKEGLSGFVKGVGKGFLGLATKPAVGAFDFASNMAEGVRNTTTVFDQEGLDRVRLTRFIGQDGILRPYSQREALGQFWLKTLDNGKYFNEDYIAHLELQPEKGGNIVMLTYNRILMVRSKKLTTEWDVPLKDIQTISKERTGMSIVLKGGAQGPFIPIADEGARNWFYKQVAVAVNAYNDKWNAKG